MPSTSSEIRKLLRNISTITGSLDDLPTTSVTTMRIAYYDDVTPPDYEPPGFRPLTENIPGFKRESSSYRCGAVETPFNKMVVSTKLVRIEEAIPSKESSQSDKFEASLYYQIASECSKMTSMSLSKLMEQFHLEPSTAMLVLKQLLKDGALKKSTHQPSIDKPDILYSVNKIARLKEHGERKQEEEENGRSSKSD